MNQEIMTKLKQTLKAITELILLTDRDDKAKIVLLLEAKQKLLNFIK